MGTDDEEFRNVEPGRVDDAANVSIAMAQGVLIERYALVRTVR